MEKDTKGNKTMNRILLTADWHLRTSRPRCRLDADWFQTQKKALEQIQKYANEHDVPVVVVGDLFNSNGDVSDELFYMVQCFAINLKHGLWILPGNHDLPYHSSENIGKSRIGSLIRSQNCYHLRQLARSGITTSAANFDQEDDHEAEIVFKHILCFLNIKDIPPGVSESQTAPGMLREFPKAQWIFTGDYHKYFHYESKRTENGRRHVVNPGCLIRQAADFIDYKCGCVLVDIDKETVERLPIIDEGELVTDEYLQQQNDRENRIEAFIEKLQTGTSVTFDFIENVNVAMESNKLGKGVRKCIEHLLEIA